MFQQGDVGWAFSRSVLLVCGAVAAAALEALLTYRGVAAADRLRDRLVLIALRVAALAVLLVCLFRPTLILKAAVPQQNFLAVLVDNSRSMAIADGADTTDAAIDESLAGLKARSIPVFTVGLGQERFARDIQVTRVETPRAVLKGTALVVDVVLSQTGYGGRTGPLSVEDDGRIVNTQEVKLPPDGESATVKVRFTANEAGARLFRFKVPTQDAEQVTQNNARDALIQVNDRVEKVLYYEGEPRYELKFVRRAVEDDKNLQLVTLDRTAENKYLRQGVSNPDELIAGFPKTREELFAYRALILGSVEAASFTPEQLRMIADFVGKRGGGLLMLGGRRSYEEGGWGGTPVGEGLPGVIGNANAQY